MAKNETLTIEQLQQQVTALKQQHGEVMPAVTAPLAAAAAPRPIASR
jgi:hypothetical protein